MCDKDGDGKSLEEFYEMVTGGKKPPLSLLGTPLAGDDMGARKEWAARDQEPQAFRLWSKLETSVRLVLKEFVDTHSIKPETIC